MSDIYSQAWVDVLNKVDNFIARSSGIVWFRGHSDSHHLLKSGLFRVNLPSLSDYLALESKYYQYYKSLGYLLHDGAEGWQLIYSLQHHGGKTRLLDWSESFVTALYFAICKWTGKTASIWLLDPLELNYLSLGSREIVLPASDFIPYPEGYNSGQAVHSVAVCPIKNTRRICTQHGVFTVQGNQLEALDREFDGALVRNGHLEIIELVDGVRQDAFRFIKQNGINHFSLFPELDGLAVYLNHLLIDG